MLGSQMAGQEENRVSIPNQIIEVDAVILQPRAVLYNIPSTTGTIIEKYPNTVKAFLVERHIWRDV